MGLSGFHVSGQSVDNKVIRPRSCDAGAENVSN